MKKGILLVNLGTPDSPATADVRKYLVEFLTDKRVIDIPWLPRQLLVRGIIGPFRAPKSAKTYKKIWTKDGSPLLVYGKTLREKVQQQLGDEYHVTLAMRYQTPSIKQGIQELLAQRVDSIRVIPLFPQYSSACNGSVIEKVMDELKPYSEIPPVTFVNQFYDHPGMISTFAEQAKKYDINSFDHILFSFHGLPVRQLRKGNPTGHCGPQPNCCTPFCDSNKHCYSAQSFETARLIAEELNIPKENYTVCFQSRLGRDPWTQPYTGPLVEELAKQGKKNVLVFCPAFVADCLETIFEIGEEYAEEFEEAGGKHLQLVESLNDHPKWVEALCDICTQPM